MVTTAGEGEVLVDGSWVRTAPEQGCLLPPRYPNAIRAVSESDVWSFCWVRYLEPDSIIPITSANRPVLGNYNSSPIINAYQGLYAESVSNENSKLMHHWVELIHGYVQDFAGPSQMDDRLWRTWDRVEEDLAANWDLPAIARHAHVSPEHFRRLCQTHLGRSPVKHLTYLRIQRGMDLLHNSSDTVESIATAFGYQTPAAFAKALRRWTGSRPSDLRS